MANGYQCDLITNNITGLPVCPHFGFAEVNMGIHAQRNMDMVIFMEHVMGTMRFQCPPISDKASVGHMWKSVGQMAGRSNDPEVSEMAGVWHCFRTSFGNP